MSPTLRLITLTLALPTLLAAQTTPRYAVSIDWHGPTIARVDPLTATPITEGDLLVPTTGPYPFAGLPALGPLFRPTAQVPHGAGGLGLAGGCVGHPPGTPCWVEVDALSFASDLMVTAGGLPPGALWFSVDAFARSTLAGPTPPSVASEAPAGDAACDAFLYPLPAPPGPVLPAGMPPASLGVVDGNGFGVGAGFAYPAVGLFEPGPPPAGPLAAGDNVDALDVAEPASGFGPLVLFSLDSAFVDPLTGVPCSGSAANPLHGFVGGDILTIGPNGVPVVWAPALTLGLDRAGLPDSDDLDALAVWDNGDFVFQQSRMPLDWTTGATDMVLFSVRRGSAVIGRPDSNFGLPISEGDILTTPRFGGLSPFPGIFYPAECLDLVTRRSTMAAFGDDLDGLDLVSAPLFDCDGNGVEDALDVFLGVQPDLNRNGVPDACEVGVGTQYCHCTWPVSACGNSSILGGCNNVSGLGAVLGGAGSASVSADNLVLTTTGMNPFGFALTFMGTSPVPYVVVQNGTLCAGGSNYRFPPYPTGVGTGALGPGLAAASVAYNPPAGRITAGSTWYFQTWYRDVGGPCGGFSNFSNALAVTFAP